MQTILTFLRQHVSGHIEGEVTAVGHRIVHGMGISRPALLDEAVINQIRWKEGSKGDGS
jgi:acetate kinase